MFNYFLTKRATSTYIKEVMENLENLNISESQILNPSKFRSKINNLKGFQTEGWPKNELRQKIKGSGPSNE